MVCRGLTVFWQEIVHGAERWLTMRRYSQFAQLDSELRDLYPKVRLPKLPPKSFALRHRTVRFRRLGVSVSLFLCTFFFAIFSPFLGLTGLVPHHVLRRPRTSLRAG